MNNAPILPAGVLLIVFGSLCLWRIDENSPFALAYTRFAGVFVMLLGLGMVAVVLLNPR